ncbi:hypothetical protein RUND412_008982 [Rhizina undulata]
MIANTAPIVPNVAPFSSLPSTSKLLPNTRTRSQVLGLLGFAHQGELDAKAEQQEADIQYLSKTRLASNIDTEINVLRADGVAGTLEDEEGGTAAGRQRLSAAIPEVANLREDDDDIEAEEEVEEEEEEDDREEVDLDSNASEADDAGVIISWDSDSGNFAPDSGEDEEEEEDGE